MKKTLLTLTAVAFLSTMLFANPVGQETARSLAQSFVRTNFEFTRQSDDLQLVKTAFSDRGEACYYVFNVGTTGFVIMAGDDCVRPIIGYSDEGTFDPNDMAPALADYLERIRLGIMAEAQKGQGNAEVRADWNRLEKTGRLVSRHGGREGVYLVQTKWNQNYPYNYFCPQAAGGPGDRCYAGCVATAGAQVMKYWNHPIQGQGSHTYYPSDHPEYGPLTANFGETTYDWDNMPISISASSPQVQIEAVARLIYHVGVSVDMNYRISGSGAATAALCETMPAYFFYTNQMANHYREDYTHQEYMQLIIDAIDMGWPMAHRGGGHAYVLDGYDDYDMVHFNWGWSGSSDGWFDIDTHGYAEGESVIYNYVPAEVYASTADAPTDVVAVASDEGLLSATITWTNPTQTLTGEALESIDQIVVARDGQVVYSEENVTPGATMSFVDESIQIFDGYRYSVYAVNGGQRGKTNRSERIAVGPTCGWRIIMQSSAFQGWYGGYVSLYSISGKEIGTFTLYNSTPASITFDVPLGNVSFGWSKPQNNINNISMVIRDADNNVVYSYSGPSAGMEQGVFLSMNNKCGSEQVTATPYGLAAEMLDDGQVELTWQCDQTPLYGFNIYRDDAIYGFVAQGTNAFVDGNVEGGHCYRVRALGEGGESDYSNETCASSGDCKAASDFDFDYVGSNYRIKLSWEKPEPHDGLSGYYLYRRFGETGDYERVKLLGASATSYTDNSANQQGDYYYRLYAYYSQTDCLSSPASIKDNPNQFYLHAYYSPTDVEELEGLSLNVFPNPADQSLNVEAEGLVKVTVCNLLGQVVCQQECSGNSLKFNTSDLSDGLYMLMVQTTQGTVARQLSIVH